MGSLEQAEALETIRAASNSIHSVLSSVEPPGTVAALKPADLPNVVHLMKRARNALSSFPESARTPELQAIIVEYRNVVERLEKILPRIQGWLLAEKVRLEHGRKKLDSAAAWAEAQKSTL